MNGSTVWQTEIVVINNIPAKAWEYVFASVSLCVCVSVCDHDN